jgi:hypothetical protein
MDKPVVTTPKADLQILEIDAWWRENRDKAPDLFEEELALALRMIAAARLVSGSAFRTRAQRSVACCFGRHATMSTTWSTKNAWWSSLCGVL